MARLPGVEEAVISEEKVRGYLLSATHPAGRGKAAFFVGCGFAAGAWQVLAEALRRHAVEHEVVGTEPSRFGVKYTVEGVLRTPGGRSRMVRVVWFVGKGEAVPRLVTAYPCAGE